MHELVTALKFACLARLSLRRRSRAQVGDLSDAPQQTVREASRVGAGAPAAAAGDTVGLG